MEVLIMLAIGTCAVVFWLGRSHQSSSRQALRALFAELGFVEQPGTPEIFRRSDDGLEIIAELKDEAWCTITVDSPSIPIGLKLSPIPTAPGEDLPPVHERIFDQFAAASGDMLAAAALLPQARRTYLHAADLGARLSEGCLTVDKIEAFALPEAITMLKNAVAALSISEGELSRRALDLLEQARGAAAIAIYRDLGKRFQGTYAKSRIDAALWHHDPEVRLLAALDAGDRLQTINDIALSPDVAAATRIRALKILAGKQLPPREELAPLFRRADADELRALLEALAHEDDAWVEAQLLAVVEYGSGEPRSVAIRALAKHGSRASLRVLREAIEGSWVQAETRVEVQATIEAIKARLDQTGGAGTLAIAETAESRGAVSVANESGALSKVDSSD